MMEYIRLKIMYIDTVLYTVYDRHETAIETNQIQAIGKYVEYTLLPGGILIPYPYNCL